MGDRVGASKGTSTCYCGTAVEMESPYGRPFPLSLVVGMGLLLAKRANSWEEELDAEWERRA